MWKAVELQPSFLTRALLGASLVLLGACNSSDTGQATESRNLPSAPTLSMTPQSIKTFRFSWAEVSDTTHYYLLENRDGVSGYSRVAELEPGTTQHDLDVLLPTRVNARYILQACNSDGCSDSNSQAVSGSLIEAIGYLKASNTEAGDLFGFRVALSDDGNTLVVATHKEDSQATGVEGDQSNNDATESGAAYVFSRTDAGWSQQAYIKASNTAAGDEFGWSIALSGDGDTLAVGAYREDSNATGIDGDQSNDDAKDSGAVYLFTRSGVDWAQQAYIKASNTDAGDRFGYRLSLAADGNRLAVGAYTEDSNATGINGADDNNLADGSGAVYLYTRNGGTWSQQSYLKASNAEEPDWFGGRLQLSGDGKTLAVGAYREDSNARGIDGDQNDNSARDSGAVYVFTDTTGTGNWSQQAYLKASNADAGDQFGWSLALADDGNTLAVGTVFETSNATGIDGDQSDNSISESGVVYLFSRSGTDWSQQAYIKASNTGVDSHFGESIALSGDGNILAVGAHLEDSNALGIDGAQFNTAAHYSGAVYVYSRRNTAWSQQAYVKASNTSRDNFFGTSVALSGDGSILAVGAYGEASNATGVGGDQNDTSAIKSGAVYLY